MSKTFSRVLGETTDYHKYLHDPEQRVPSLELRPAEDVGATC